MDAHDDAESLVRRSAPPAKDEATSVSRRKWVVGGVTLIVLAAAIAITVAATSGDDDDDAAAATSPPTGPPVPPGISNVFLNLTDASDAQLDAVLGGCPPSPLAPPRDTSNDLAVRTMSPRTLRTKAKGVRKQCECVRASTSSQQRSTCPHQGTRRGTTATKRMCDGDRASGLEDRFRIREMSGRMTARGARRRAPGELRLVTATKTWRKPGTPRRPGEARAMQAQRSCCRRSGRTR